MRRRRSFRRQRANNALQLAQIGTLLVVLVMLLAFRDRIAENAGAFLGAFSAGDDLRVEADMGSQADAAADASVKNSAR